MAEEATVNADGSQTFETPTGTEEAFNATADEDFAENAEEILEEVTKGIDPAIFLALFVVIIVAGYFMLFRKKTEEDDFFAELDIEKFNLTLPVEVDQYYQIKDKVIASGKWEPGKGPDANAAANANGPHRILAQALMKRCIADIPLVTHIQKESAGMNKLYAQSMCSVKQWRAYQAAEALVSSEVDEVRVEADEIEPGWSQMIWRQAMQYHNMLKQKHEQEAKEAAEAAAKKKAITAKVNAAKKEITDAKAQEEAAEKAALELIKAEEREKHSKKSFKGNSSMKKGFLEKKK